MIPSGLKSVPRRMLPICEKIVAATDEVCDRHLNPKYRELARAMTAALCRKRPAFLLDCRAAELGGEDAIADRVEARRVRERVVEICKQLLEEGIRGESANKKGEDEYWVRATLVEALFGLGKAAESGAEFVVAKKAALEPWMINTTEEQLAKLRALLR
jgi:Domain of unknown function (DUF6398)